MRSAVLDLAWYQYLLLDVVAVLALAVVSTLPILLLLCRVILNKLIVRKSQEENTEPRRRKQN